MHRATALAAAMTLSFALPAVAGEKPGHGHDMHGMHGMKMKHMWMMRHHRKSGWGGPEVRYLTGMQSAATGFSQVPTATGLVFGRGHSGEVAPWFSIGGNSNLALQLTPGAGNGSWIAPYWGVLPRLGFGLGPVRLDAGVLGGFGGMVRTSASDVVQARAMWVLEPRLELGYRGDHFGIFAVGAYLMTPNMADLGGLSAGLRLTFGGGKGHGHDDDDDDEDDDDDDEGGHDHRRGPGDGSGGGMKGKKGDKAE
jgi:hypothetical protein